MSKNKGGKNVKKNGLLITKKLHQTTRPEKDLY